MTRMTVLLFVLVVVVVVGAGQGAGGEAGEELKVHVVDKTIANKYNARCLDGTRPGYYFAPFSNTSQQHDWVLYIRGGGWCFTEAECVQRSRTKLGTTTNLTATVHYSGGYLASDPAVNPVFAGANRVLLWYCDGASFAGNREKPVRMEDGTTLHFRGFANLHAILASLLLHHGLDLAERVLLSGGSAGGLATFLHANTVQRLLPPSVTKYKVSPVSGFFLEHADASGRPLYPDRMRSVFHMQNCTCSVGEECVAVHKQDPSACMFAQHQYPHVRAPIFLLQSLLDAYQLDDIYPAAASWDPCVRQGHFEQCSASELLKLDAYGFDLLGFINGTSTFSRDGNGGFFHGCRTHVAAQATAWAKFAVDGVVMRDTANAWWLDDHPHTPAAKHTYVQRTLLQRLSPHQTNPTCL